MTTPAELLSHPRYEAGEVLGHGAQGVVARVTDLEAPGRALCAKVWRSDVFDEGALLGEFALLARLRIPGLVRAHDLGRDTKTGAPFLVEDFVGGDDVATHCGASTGSVRAARLTHVVCDIATTLALLHDAGFVHGDLKPAHARVRQVGGAIDGTFGAEPQVVLLDLGSAVSRARGSEAPVSMTRAFAAPERLAGGPPSPSSDLYALGALAWCIAVGDPPATGRSRPPLRRSAPWVPPPLADLIETLLAPHPRDRPESARAVLASVSAALRVEGLRVGLPPAPVGRARELAELLARPAPPVRYLVGPSGIGKSHLARELVTRTLLAGRAARLVAFPCESPSLVGRLVAFLRGRDEAWPFVGAPPSHPMLLVLDGLDLAPDELIAALDAFRCRPRAAGSALEVLATSRTAPAGADVLEMGPLSASGFTELCAALGLTDEQAMAEAAAASGRNPGWLAASVGSVPLTQGAVLERAGSLSEAAKLLLTGIATAGGPVTERFCQTLLGTMGMTSQETTVISELCRAGLVARRAAAKSPEGAGSAGVGHVLTAPGLARDLASGLSSFDRVDRIAEAMLLDPDASASALLSAASADHPPARRTELCERAAVRARSDGLRSVEIDALLALVGDPAARTVERLRRLERLTRDAGAATMHPQVLDWLDEAARAEPRIAPLALRRRAERLARNGERDAAERAAKEARRAARDSGNPVEEAFALATIGAVALFRASFEEADVALAEARAMLLTLEVEDAEEVARLEHNLGVVALYRGRFGEAVDALTRSLAEKRRLGDRAGMRSALLNLGLALAKAGRLDDADRALDEAVRLAQSLGQDAGRGWCLAARADVAVRRGTPEAAERWIAEAETLHDALPAAVRADLCLLRGQVALLEGDGARALAALARIGGSVREGDALVDARAITIEAAAHLATLPTDRRKAARLAIRAARAAREARLTEVEVQARDVLRRARATPTETTRRAPASTPGYPGMVALAIPTHADDALAWRWLGDVAAGLVPDEAALELARLIARASRAERAFVARLDPGGNVVEAWGADIDGLTLSEARSRIAPELVNAASSADAPVYQRDVATVGGRGSRLAAAGPAGDGAERALVVAEHRFASGYFDAVGAAEVGRWVTLAALTLRLAQVARAATMPSAGHGEIAPDRIHGSAPRTGQAPDPQAPGLTTVLPSRVPRSFPDIVGCSAALGKALGRLEAALGGDLPVLVVGETGSGKELFARALHDHGPRASRAFVAVNCGAIPDALFEAELFGHARGSFTGADQARRGLLPRAEGGTLLLDEIGELPLGRQAGLLRALESRCYRPVGSDDERPFDVRIVAATNRDLELATLEGTFRRDLLYRLNAIEIRVPPLRERPDDVPLLIAAFLARAGSRSVVTRSAAATLAAYPWPGNVRELEHQVQRLAALELDAIDVGHLPRSIRAYAPAGSRTASSGERTVATEQLAGASGPEDPREEVRLALERTKGNISRAAELLGLTRHGLKKRMVRLGLRPLRTASDDDKET